MSIFNTYIFVVAYDNPTYTSVVLDCYLKAKKPNTVKLILVDNSQTESIVENSYFDYIDIEHFKTNTKCKSKALNEAIHRNCKQDTDFIICLDNDVEFDNSFFLPYIEKAGVKGIKYYYGTSLKINKRYTVSPHWLKIFLQGSQKGKSDVEFKSNSMFFGCSFAFFKKQWKDVNGFDERFGPGSKLKMGSQESIFQKKLKYVGYKPYLIKNNALVHKPLESSYTKEKILARVKKNGLTHGYQSLIESNSFFKIEFFKKIYIQLKSILLNIFRGNKVYIGKIHYLIGLFKALSIYHKTNKNDSIYKGLKKM